MRNDPSVPVTSVPPWLPFKTRRSRLLGRAGLYGGAVTFGVPLALSQVMVSPLRQATGAPPPPFEEARVLSEGLSLRTWTVRGSPRRAAVVVAHGVGDTLESFTGVAHRLHARGHTVLLLDLRGHGGSEGRYTTLGGREREDVRAAMGHLRARSLAPAGFVLMGYSMGSAAVLRAAALEADTRAVVAEAPFDTYRDTVAHHGTLLYGLPRWFPLTPVAIALAEWRAGFDADEVDVVAAAAGTRAALLAIADGADPRMPEAVVRRVYDAHRGPKAFWVAPDAEHAGASLRAEYWPTVIRFLEGQGL
jgi:pimeloyl-ACP methyl ester carboxylesterase